MNNPWAAHTFELNKPPFLLEQDRQPVEEFNDKKPHADHYIHPYLLPEPFLGDSAAPIVLLNGNPGYSDSDKDAYQCPKLFELSTANLRHAAPDYPFYLLNPAIKDFGGYKWWGLKLKPLLNLFDRKLLARNLLVVEYFPYHSRRSHSFHRQPSVPSQEYSFYLVEQALQRQALVIMMRWSTPWFARIPALQHYPDLYRLNAPIAAVISPRNCPGGFEKIVDRINAAPKG